MKLSDKLSAETLRTHIKDLKEKLTQAEKLLLDIICPYKVGDVVNGRRSWKINSVSLNGDKWRVYARVIKKDGSLGVASADWGEVMDHYYNNKGVS